MRTAQARGDGIRDRDKVRIGRLRSRWNARNLKIEWESGGEGGRMETAVLRNQTALGAYSEAYA